MIRTTALAALLTLVAPQFAHAADACDDAQDQATMTACAVDSLKTTDAALNALYRSIEGRLAGDEETRTLLVHAQREWIRFRDAECAFRTANAAGGSAEPMLKAMCLDELTKARVDGLGPLLHCEEGDLGCPVPGDN